MDFIDSKLGNCADAALKTKQKINKKSQSESSINNESTPPQTTTPTPPPGGLSERCAPGSPASFTLHLPASILNDGFSGRNASGSRTRPALNNPKIPSKEPQFALSHRRATRFHSCRHWFTFNRYCMLKVEHTTTPRSRRDCRGGGAPLAGSRCQK